MMKDGVPRNQTENFGVYCPTSSDDGLQLTATLKVSLQWIVDTMLPFDVLATVVIVESLTVAMAWTKNR